MGKFIVNNVRRHFYGVFIYLSTMNVNDMIGFGAIIISTMTKLLQLILKDVSKKDLRGSQNLKCKKLDKLKSKHHLSLKS